MPDATLVTTGTLLLTLDLIGTFVFAISGAASGVKSRLDVFGVSILAFVAGNAGGVTRDVLIGAVPPVMLKSASNPGGLPIDAFDQIRSAVLTDRAQYFKDLSAPFYGANRPGSNVSQGLRDSFWLQGMLAGQKAAYDCIKAFSETDFTEDLKKFDVPTLIIHGDDDQIVPIGASAMLSSKIVKGATLKVYPGAPHGMCSTLKDKVNAELLQFFQKRDQAAA